MKATFLTPQAPSPGRVQGRAGANLTAQDRARGAFQELLSQKIEQKAEQIEQQNTDGTARSAQPRLGRCAAHGRKDTAGSGERPNASRQAENGRPASAKDAAPLGRDIQVKDGRFSRAELPDGSRGHIRNGFAVGPNGEMKKDGKILTGINGIVYVGGRGSMKAKGPEETAPGKSAGAPAPSPAAGRFLKVHLMGETNLFSKQTLQRWQERHQQTEPTDGNRGHILKGIFVGPRGELLDARGNLIGKTGPIHPRSPGSAKAMEEIAPVRHKDLKPSFGQTPFCAAGEGPTVGAAGETLDVTTLWKQFMMRWIEGSRDPEDGETSDEEEADRQSDKAERERGAKRFVAVQSDQVAGLERNTWRSGVPIDGDRNLMGKNAPVHLRGRMFGAAGTAETIDPKNPKRGMGALKAQEKATPTLGKDAEAVQEFLKQARIAGMAGPSLTPAQILGGAAGEEPLDARSLWKEFMRRWMEGQKEGAADGAPAADSLDAFRARSVQLA